MNKRNYSPPSRTSSRACEGSPDYLGDPSQAGDDVRVVTIKQIILCADDYAQNSAICDGIIALLDKQRLNATSCLVNSERWGETHQALIPFKTTAHIGLHLNLTFGKPLSSLWKKHYGDFFDGLGPLIRRCYSTGNLKHVIAEEIKAQVDTFSDAMGMSPDFIDGHQHVHQLPGIRDVLIELHIQHNWTCFFRNTSNGNSDYLSLAGFPKRQLISFLGGSTFRNRLTKNNIATNASFAGIYNFKNAMNYRDYFKQFLKLCKTDALIMCHPGMRSTDHSDPLYQSRHHEFDYLISDDFLHDLEASRVCLMPS